MPSFGQKLRAEREKKGVSLDDISVSTKIGTRMLRALEEGHFEQLPGGIFNKGFVRAYARHVGLNEEQTIADYLEAAGEGPPKEAPGRQDAPRQQSPREELRIQEAEGENAIARIPWGVLALALLAVALGFAIWGFRNREKEKENRREQKPAGQMSTPSPEIQAASLEPKPAASSILATPNEPGSTAAQIQPASSVSPEPSNAAAPPATGTFVVLIKAQEECWTSIAVDGEKPAEFTLEASSQKSITAHKEVIVRVGNMGAVDLFFNGKKLSAQGDYEQVKTLTFDQNGLKPAPPPKSATQ